MLDKDFNNLEEEYDEDDENLFPINGNWLGKSSIPYSSNDQKIIDTLNKLNNLENQFNDLKNQFDTLNSSVSGFKLIPDTLIVKILKANEDLKEENEKLKKENEELKNSIEYKNYSKVIEEFEENSKKQIEEIQELETFLEYEYRRNIYLFKQIESLEKKSTKVINKYKNFNIQDAIRKLNDDKMSYREIAQLYDMPVSTLYYRINKINKAHK